MTLLRRNGSSVAVAIQPAVRCAIYCRKSTDEGLDKEFNSLDAQREACDNYIASMRAEHWSAIADRYDDGGFSGGTTERPALKQLVVDIEAGLVDCLVVYKYDRLSRSMLDFLQLLDFFKLHGVSFVSVSQRFDTSTPVGEVTLNILLSFAQFERQMIAERTRDKIHAARRRGRWTGGRPVIGYDAVDGRLVVNKDEAPTVKAIFEMYAAAPSITATVEELNRRGWRQKSWTTKTGKDAGGGSWNKSSLRTLLTNPLYAGLQKLGTETFRGDHKAIVPRKSFDRVQWLLNRNRVDRGASRRNTHGALLRGILRCASCDSSMSFAPVKRRGKLYRYYRCSASIKRGQSTCSTGCVSADRVEQFVVDQIRRIGTDPQLQDETFRQAVGQVKAQRRGLRAEAKRIERDQVTVRADVERLVAAVSRTTGPAADAIAAELDKTQTQLATLESRQVELRDEIARLKTQEIDRNELTGALEEFDPIWEALLTPERERMMKLLVQRIDYDGTTKRLTISWRLAGFGELAEELS